MSADAKSFKTLPLIYLRQVSASLLIYQPIFVPFLLSRGLNMVDVAFLQTAYNLGVLLLDIPTGYFADKFGRKWALALCNTSLAVGTFLIAIGHSLSVFILAELFYAFAIAMDAGIHSAYLYDWLRSRGRESEYYRFDAFGTFLVLILGAAGTLLAGYFAEQDLTIPVVLTVALTAIGIPAACLLPRSSNAGQQQHQDARRAGPRTSGSISRPGKFAPIESITAMSPPAVKNARGGTMLVPIRAGIASVWHLGAQIFETPGLRWALGVTVLLFWARQYVNFMISQPYFKSIGLALRHFGILYAIMTLASGMIALWSRRLMQRPDLRVIAAVAILLVPTSFGIMGLVPGLPGMTGFFLFAIPYGLCTAVSNTLLNRQFDNHGQRATFLSIVDFFVRLFASVLAIVLGWLLAKNGAASALVAAMAFSGFIVVTLLPGLPHFAALSHRQEPIE